MKNPRFVTLMVFILMAAISRVVPHPWNATPLAAMALFAGAHFINRKVAFLVPLGAMFLSDLVIGFYPTWPVTYLCFIGVVLMGQQLQTNKSFSRVAFGTIGASLLFFVVTNFVCWLTMIEYSKDFSGLSLCYVRALPFFRNTLSGDLFFSALLFGSFALSEKKFPALRQTSQLA